MRRPTRRAFIIAGSGVLLMMAGSTAQAGWLFVLASTVFALVLASFLFPHHLGHVRLNRQMPKRVRVGDDVHVVMTLANAGDRTVPMMRVEDRLPALDAKTIAAEAIPPGGRAVFESVRPARLRGVYAGGDALLVGGAPFGLSTTRRTIPATGRLTVVPRWVDISDFPLIEPSAATSDVEHARARTGTGDEYVGVREYRPGDPRKAVHWRTSARAGKLVVREFDEHLLTRVGLVVAGQDAGEPPDSAFESMVSAAASVGLYALGMRHPVDLVLGDELVTDGRVDRRDLLDHLAAVRPAPWDPPRAIGGAIDAIGGRGTVIICTTTAALDHEPLAGAVKEARAAGVRMVLVVVRASDWDPKAPDREILGALSDAAGLRVVGRQEDMARCLAS